MVCTADGLRSSGIPVLGEMPWGTHFCQFYQTKAHLLDVLVPYFQKGLENDEFCVWVTSEALTTEEAREGLIQAVPDLADREARGQFEVFPYTDWYMKDGCFDMKRILDGWAQKYQQGLDRGYAGLRVSGNTAWLESENWESFSEYEHSIDGAIEGARILVLCTYSLDRCGPYELMDVVRNHQFALVLGQRGWERIENAELRRVRELQLSTQEQLRKTAEELARSNQELEQFAYVASHDLQEPLRAISGYLGLMEAQLREKLDNDSRKYLAGAVEGAARMSTLITDLLTLSRVGTQGKPFEPADLNTVLDQVLDALSVSMKESGARVTRDPLPILPVDAVQITQLFQNLIANAIKFHGEKRPEIHVSARPKGDHCVLAVRDNGIGIEPQYFERIFQVFQRLHTRREYPGTGIGLAVCKKIVDRHGGRIWVESQPGRGSSFFFTLPDSKKS